MLSAGTELVLGADLLVVANVGAFTFDVLTVAEVLVAVIEML